jgi:glycosyltransferase involved in cell wall biosynthesis
MKIAFDSKIFTMQEYGGISRYICSLAQQLNTHQDVEAKIFAPFHINAYADSLPSSLAYGVKVPRVRNAGRIVHVASQLLSRVDIRRYKPQIVHETYFSNLSSTPQNARCIITVHDMIHERFSSAFPSNDPTSEWKRKSIKRADHVICVSENTKQDLLEFIDISPEKISVVHHGFDTLNLPINISKTPNQPYLLYVGNRWGYKNFDGLLRAYASSSWLRSNLRIVCFGGGRLEANELSLIKTLGLTLQQVEQVSGSDDQLAACYKNAAAFVYPSLYEGFGIPPMEAMSLNCPVICSDASSIPEVVGDAAEYFDPKSIDSITVAIVGVLQSAEKRDDFIAKGVVRCSNFTWNRCANETLAVYEKILKE